MLETFITHIPSTLLHGLLAMLIMTSYFRGNNSRQYPSLFLMISVLAVFSLDVPKLFGIVSLHSLLIAPFIALALALFFKNQLPYNLFFNWVGMCLVLMIGGILVDVWGNGAHILYPIVRSNISFPILEGTALALSIGVVSLALLVQLRRHDSK
ncbi:hypothetical protein N781_05075 [Pontibacillus halophilus JSM 076056 = DSM 19796]|uniref:Uncharacterized protein n=1 Tax=Pontibacillus halophilus JSM 076056 = DSM 19796 TaxID=1385510 RepID=A0A0A5GGP4_9BACI|nr:hypothetical protein [Pontibacillus halophilus]KGX91164.1 hypothetical protein N781_05075 [Pontibacillus halophilus JSM 076056 = DSM 19796]